jgi:indoleamine 2,3-dioxygenase
LIGNCALLTKFRLDIPPFMSYAAAYSLYNYSLADPKLGTSEYSNLRLVRAFEKGLDPSSSEAGFVLTHVHMVEKTAPLINGAVSLLSIIEDTPSDTSQVHHCFYTMLSAMEKIEASMENMWTHSLPKDYNSYRTFIFGITNQSMFPDGVVYDGINENKPLFFRGESGANDSIIPLLDHLLEITGLMPVNPLTEILKDFRSYRPKPHREFLAWVLSKGTELGVRDFCCNRSDKETTVLYLRLLDHVRSFRWRHWLFAREYIIRRSKHPTATGGSPIVTWLPNQLFAVMDLMIKTYHDAGLEKDMDERKGLTEMMDNVKDQRVKLGKEVDKWCQERGT